MQIPNITKNADFTPSPIPLSVRRRHGGDLPNIFPREIVRQLDVHVPGVGVVREMAGGGVDGEEEGYVKGAAGGSFEGSGSLDVARVEGVGGVFFPGDFGVHEGLVGGGFGRLRWIPWVHEGCV